MRVPGSVWPNLITSLRLVLLPLVALSAEAANRAAAEGADPARWRWTAVGLLVAIGASDVLDGHLARRHDWATNLGAILDAVADKLVQVVLVTYLALRPGDAFPELPLWLLALLVMRDVVLLSGTLAVRARRGRVEVVHETHGKLASLLLFALLLWTLLGRAGPLALALSLATAALVVLSTAGYVRAGFAQARSRSA